MSTDYVAFGGKVPENYDRYLGPFLFEPFAVDLVSRITKTGVRSILELACGTGRVTRHLREAFPPPVELTASDFNPGMLRIAQDVVKDDTIQYVEADAQAIPFDDSTFDVVVFQFGLMFVPDKAKAMKEVYRVLKDGGQFLFNTWGSLERNPASYLADEAIREYFGTGAPSFFSIPFSLYDEKVLKDLLRQGGFSNFSIDHKRIDTISPSPEEAAKGMIIGTPAYDEISKRDAAAPAKIVELATRKIKNRYGTGNIETESTALVCKAIK